MKKKLVILAILFSALTLSAQDVVWKFTYDIGVPLAETKEFADQVSWRGLALDFDRFVSSNFAIGMGFSWSTFLEKESDSYYEINNGLAHGTQVRYINTIPLLARFSWYKQLTSSEMSLFGTMGVGTLWQETRREIGTFAFVDDYWQFALAPEVGMIFPVGYSSSITAKIRYMHGFGTSDGAPPLQYLGIGVGFAW